MSNRVTIGLRSIDTLNPDLSKSHPDLGPFVCIYAHDDSDECDEYVCHLNDITDADREYINTIFTDPKEAIKWLARHEPEYSSLCDWSVKHGLQLGDDWIDPQRMQAAYEEVGDDLYD